MTQTYGSEAPVRWERRPDRLSRERTEKDVMKILELLVEVRRLWEEAVDGAVYPMRTSGLGESRHTGFDDNDPTHSAATRPTQKQLRGSAKHAAALIADARQRLEDASWVLSNGLLRTDTEEWIQHRQKRAASTQDG